MLYYLIGREDILEMRGTGGANKVADKRCLQAPVVLPLTKSPKGKKGGGGTELQAEGYTAVEDSVLRLLR
jgi:hypothetical protein